MTHYDQEAPFIDRIRAVDPVLARDVDRWNTHLPATDYARRIRTLVQDCDDVKHWEGSDGDDAARIGHMAREHLHGDLHIDELLLEDRR